MKGLPAEMDLGLEMFGELVPEHKNHAIKCYINTNSFEEFAFDFQESIIDAREKFIFRHKAKGYDVYENTPPNGYRHQCNVIAKHPCNYGEMSRVSVSFKEYPYDYNQWVIYKVTPMSLNHGGGQVEAATLVYFALEACLNASRADVTRQSLLKELKGRLSMLSEDDKHGIRDFKRVIQHLETEADTKCPMPSFDETEDNWFKELLRWHHMYQEHGFVKRKPSKFDLQKEEFNVEMQRMMEESQKYWDSDFAVVDGDIVTRRQMDDNQYQWYKDVGFLDKIDILLGLIRGKDRPLTYETTAMLRVKHWMSFIRGKSHSLW